MALFGVTVGLTRKTLGMMDNDMAGMMAMGGPFTVMEARKRGVAIPSDTSAVASLRSQAL